MKTFIESLLKLVFLSLLILHCSCTKNVPGPKGEQGAAGKKGNAVQSHVAAFLLDSMSWTLNEFIWESSITTPQIDDAALLKADIKVYMQIDGLWWSLPYSKLGYGTSCSFAPGKINLRHFYSHTTVPKRPPNTMYRVVIVKPYK